MKRLLFLFLTVLTTPLAAQALTCDTSACGTRINDFEEQQCRTEKVLACEGYDISAIPKIELQVQSTSDLVYISVGNAPAVSLYPRHMGKPLNISHMFTNGLEKLRVQAFTEKEGQQYSLSFAILYNGQQKYSVACNVNSCSQGKVSRQDGDVGPFFDQIFDIQVSSPVQPEYYSLNFSGLASDLKTAVYINDQYTGLSVQQARNLRLPPGEYRIGVGVSSEKEVQYRTFQGAPRYLKQYTGKYYEQRVQRPSDLQNFAYLQPLPFQDIVRIGVVPIRTMIDGQQTYTVTQTDVDRLTQQMSKTITSYVQPLSFGLQTWSVEFEPFYDPVVIGDGNGEVDAEKFFYNNKPDLLNKYDVIIAYYGNQNNHGAAASNGFIHLPKGNVIDNPSVTNDQGGLIEELPLEIFLHETSHVLEQNERELLQLWKGFAGADGGEILGYKRETTDTNPSNLWTQPAFMNFYRDYMRGQAVTTNDMSKKSHYPAPAIPSNYLPYRYIGVLGTIRNGISNLHEMPPKAIPAIETYRIYNAHFDKYLGATTSPSVTAAPWNLHYPPDDEPVEYVRLQNGSNMAQFLHLDEGGTKILRSTDISADSWSSHWIPVQVNGRTLLKSRWTGEYLALTDAATLTVVTNAERQALPLDKLAWEFIPHVILNNLSSGYSFIKSASSSTAVHVENGAPEVSAVEDGWHSAHWSFMVIDGKYVKITNRWKAQSLHIQNGSLQASEAPDGWHSAQWELEAVTGVANTYILKNRHQPNQYLNIDGGTLKSSVVPATNTSTHWKFQKVQ